MKKRKHILGLDLGTTSIGFSHIIEDEDREKSTIEEIGVRIIPLSVDELSNFERGKTISTNADRTLKHGARINLDRYQLRRKQLIELSLQAGLITSSTILAEDGKNTTHSTWQLRAKAAVECIEKDELVRVFLAINKKRGYKSSRKVKNKDDGQIIDGMDIAKRLYDENLTPGQLVLQLLKEKKKQLPDFYHSDLQREFDLIWNFQKEFYPDILTNDLYKALQGKNKTDSSSIFYNYYHFNTAENRGTKEQMRLQAYRWRVDALSKKLSKEEVAYVLYNRQNEMYQKSK